jgi:hypothetical protein
MAQEVGDEECSRSTREVAITGLPLQFYSFTVLQFYHSGLQDYQRGEWKMNTMSKGREPITGQRLKTDSYSILEEDHAKLNRLAKKLRISKAQLIRDGIKLIFEQNREVLAQLEQEAQNN